MRTIDPIAMKAFIIIALLCISIYCCDAEKVTTYGKCAEFPLIGKDRIYQRAHLFRVQTKVIKFPKVNIARDVKIF